LEENEAKKEDRRKRRRLGSIRRRTVRWKRRTRRKRKIDEWGREEGKVYKENKEDYQKNVIKETKGTNLSKEEQNQVDEEKTRRWRRRKERKIESYLCQRHLCIVYKPIC
jgi:hypothetical protein